MNERRSKTDCCDTDVPQPQYTNPPGQPHLTYRTGRYHTSLARMLARLSTETIPDGDQQAKRPLAKLTTRDFADPAIALLSAWAMSMDIASFYMELFANEGYLRTLTERRSALNLARTIGYELNPGVAASTYLAFTIDGSATAPGEALIPAGTPVKSIPPAGKLPQTFETAAEFKGYAAWNQLRPRLTYPQHLAIYNGKLFLLDLDNLYEGTSLPIANIYLCDDVLFDAGSTTVNAVEVAQLYIKGTSTTIKPGQVLLLAGKRQSDTSYSTFIRPVLRVEKQAELQRTRLDLDVDTAPPQTAFIIAPVQYTLMAAPTTSFSGSSIQAKVSSNTLSNAVLNAMIVVNNWPLLALLNFLNQPKKFASLPDNQGVFIFNSKMGFFGVTAPEWNSLPYSQRVSSWVLKDAPSSTQPAYEKDPSPYTTNWDRNGWEIWKSYKPGNYYSNSNDTPADVYLERETEDISRNDWVVFENATDNSYYAYRVAKVRNSSISGFSLTAKTTGLNLVNDDGNTLNYNNTDRPSKLKIRTATAHFDNERLVLADMPILEPLQRQTIIDDEIVYGGVSQIMLDELVTNLQVGQAIAVHGEQADAEDVMRHEIAIIDAIDHVRGYTVLTLAKSLQYRYVRDTVSINTNVVRATHGESVTEILGSGDSTQTNQRFSLKKPPLTYIAAPTERGSKSTMTIRINNVEWKEHDALYGLSSNDEGYVIRLEDNGSVHVIFGDGKRGTRIPTGQNNVTASYRSGIGEDGEVAADSLSLMAQKPLHVRSVTNPIAASGAESPETLDNARLNAPLNVLTMGRIVSLQDFEDFARAFAGVGKAAVRVLWTGETDLVHITIASATGKLVESTSDLYTNLVSAIDRVRDPIQQVRIDTFALHLFNVKASILVDMRYIAADVLADVEATLIDTFKFEKRQFGQAVRATEVIGVIQNVSGVVAVDLDQLYRVTDSTGTMQTIPPPILPALPVRWSDSGQLLFAELLLINNVGIDLREMSS